MAWHHGWSVGHFLLQENPTKSSRCDLDNLASHRSLLAIPGSHWKRPRAVFFSCSSPAHHHHHHHRRNNQTQQPPESKNEVGLNLSILCPPLRGPAQPSRPVAQWSNARTARYRRDGYAPANERQVVSESRRLLSDRRPAAGPSSPSYTTDGLTLYARHVGVVDSTRLDSTLRPSRLACRCLPPRPPAFPPATLPFVSMPIFSPPPLPSSSSCHHLTAPPRRQLTNHRLTSNTSRRRRKDNKPQDPHYSYHVTSHSSAEKL
ncbi:hypothetical protein BKA81DRAFT_420006 [Phyllosticta paracitricarpa]|uniref:Uncharacterized protein n=2 Tax=Phyllosticta TaxID=121621 RepID=A0ABR1LWF8_9PEZI